VVTVPTAKYNSFAAAAYNSTNWPNGVSPNASVFLTVLWGYKGYGKDIEFI